MAKTESTAVNELIELVATQKPLQPDSTEDLMFRAPAKKVSMPRMTSTVPPIHGAGDVAPLPRTRAPQGTQRNVPALGAPPVPQPTIRVTTAPPTRSTTIPPIGPKQLADQAPAEPPDSMIATTPNLAAQLRNSSPRATMMGTSPPVVPPPPHSSPRATMMGTSAPPVVPPPLNPARATTVPPSMPVAAPFESRPANAPTVPFVGAPIAPIATPVYPPMAPPPPPYLQPHDMTSNQAWFDQELLNDGVEQEIGTARIAKGSDWKAIIPKLIAPMIGLVIIGVFVGGYFAFDGDGGKKRAPSAAPSVTTTEVGSPAAEPAKAEPAAKADEPVAPAKADEPVAPAKADEPAKTDEPVAAAKADEPVAPKADQPVAAVVAPAVVAKAAVAPVTPPNLAPTAGTPAKTEPVAVPGRPKLVDVRIDSKPSGATVMLVDRGKTTFLGTTPISTAVDGSRKYDLVFTYPNKPTQLEHLDPSSTSRVAVTLGKLGNQAKAAKVRSETRETRKAEPAKVVSEREKAVVEPALEKPAQPAGEGVLMISSKPPCEILVDGAATGLTTPQRAIKLTAGKHKITLVNTPEKIKKTIAVQITADQPTKVIQDLMK